MVLTLGVPGTCWTAAPAGSSKTNGKLEDTSREDFKTVLKTKPITNYGLSIWNTNEGRKNFLNNLKKDGNIVKDVMNGKFLEILELRMLPEEISHAVLDEAVDLYINKAFEKIVNLVQQKRFCQRWPCCMCGKDTEKNDRTLGCSGCLLWRHIRCAGFLDLSLVGVSTSSFLIGVELRLTSNVMLGLLRNCDGLKGSCFAGVVPLCRIGLKVGLPASRM
nr:unnamed protein product [Callosobruchus analis]